MLAAAPAVKAPRRCPFRCAPWPRDPPDWRAVDAALPADHPARWFDARLDRLDLGPLRPSYAGRGSRAPPPDRLLPLVLYLLFDGTRAPARWQRASRFDLPCRGLRRRRPPARSSRYAFRDRRGPFLDDWPAQRSSWAPPAGVTAAAAARLDGTLVPSRASRHQLLGAAALARRLAVRRQAIAWDHAPPLPEPDPRLRAGREAERPGRVRVLLAVELVLGTYRVPGPRWRARSARGRARQQQRYRQAQQRWQQQQAGHAAQPARVAKAQRRPAEQLKVSPADPDAVLGKDKQGVYRPRRNLQLVRATDGPRTRAWDVLARHNDRGQWPPMVRRSEGLTGRPRRRVLVDGAYVTLADVQGGEERGLEVLAPVGPEAEPAADAGCLPKGAFTWDAASQTYTCPEGQRRPRRQRTTETREGGVERAVRVYRADGPQCPRCPRQPACTSNPRRGRVVKRSEGAEALPRLRQRLGREESQRAYRPRSQTVELGYADVKAHRGRHAFRSWGRPRARIQAGLVLLACNLMNVQRARLRRAKQRAPTPP